MSEYNWDDFEDETEEQTEPQLNPGNLPKELRKVIRDAKRAEKEALTKVQTLESQIRQSTVNGVLSSRGVPAKVAQLIPGNVEATPEAIGKWLDDFGDVFGVQQSANESGSTVSNGAPDTVPPAQMNADQAAMQRMQQTASSGEQFSNQQALLAKLNDPNLTEEELDNLIAGASR